MNGVAAVARQRDRRRGFGEVLSALARGIGNRDDPGRLRGAFEEALRRALSIRSVHLRDAGARWAPRTDGSTVESVAFDVPGPTARTRGVLEAAFDPACRPGEWDFQMLAAAAHLGALLLEVERARLHLARSDQPGVTPKRPDGAAPLIGSTPAMGALRSRIERVAVTDFTVLLEGSSDPQQKAKDGAFP